MTPKRPALPHMLAALTVAPLESLVRWGQPARVSLLRGGVCLDVEHEGKSYEAVTRWRHRTAAEAREALVAAGLVPEDAFDPDGSQRAWWSTCYCHGSGFWREAGPPEDGAVSCAGSDVGAVRCDEVQPRRRCGRAEPGIDAVLAVFSMGIDAVLRAEALAREAWPAEPLVVWRPMPDAEIQAIHRGVVGSQASDRQPFRSLSHTVRYGGPAYDLWSMGVQACEVSAGRVMLIVPALRRASRLVEARHDERLKWEAMAEARADEWGAFASVSRITTTMRP